MDMHEHIKEFWPKRFAITHYEKHIAWCRMRIEVVKDRGSAEVYTAWYQKQIDKCLERIADYGMA